MRTTVYDRVKERLSNLDWPGFFAELPEILCQYERNHSLDEALKVAKFQKNAEQVKQLAKHVGATSTSTSTSSLVRSAVDWLLENKEEDAVLHLAVFGHEDYASSTWLSLAKYFFRDKRWSDIEKTLAHIDNNYEKRNFLNDCLRTVNPKEGLMRWLWCYEQQLLADPPKKSAYGDQIQYPYCAGMSFGGALPVLLAYQPLAQICERLKSWTEPLSRVDMIEHFYLYALTQDQLTVCEQLNEILPSELLWMRDLKLIFEDEQYFELLEKVSRREFRESLREKALRQFFSRHAGLNDDELFEKIRAVVYLPSEEGEEDCLDLIGMSVLVQACCEKQCVDIALRIVQLESRVDTNLLKTILAYPLTAGQCDQVIMLLVALWQEDQFCYYYSSRKDILNLLAKQSLTDHQFREILPFIELDQPAYWRQEEAVVSQIPAHLLEAEKQRRVQVKQAEEAEKSVSQASEMQKSLRAFEKISKVSKKSRDYPALDRLIGYFSGRGELSTVLMLCNKMVKSGYRDDYLRQGISAAIRLDQFHLVTPFLKLFCKKDKASVIRQVAQRMRGKNYKKTLKYLMSLDSVEDFYNEILFHVENILADHNVAAIAFVLNQHVFKITFYYPHGKIREKLENVVLARLGQDMLACETVDILREYLKHFSPDSSTKKVCRVLIKGLLEQDSLDFAMELANFCFDKNSGDHSYREDSGLENIFLTYFNEKKVVLTAPFLATVSALTSSIRHRLIAQLWDTVRSKSMEEKLQLLEMMEGFYFKHEELMSMLANELRKERFVSARQVTACLPESEQLKWRGAIELAEAHQHHQLWGYLLAHRLNCQPLLDQAAQGMAAQQPADENLVQMLSLLDEINELESNRSQGYSSALATQQPVALSMRREIYRVLYRCWSGQLAKNSVRLFAGIKCLLSRPQPSYYGVISPIEKLVTVLDQMILQGQFDCILELVALIESQQQQAKPRYHYHNDRYDDDYVGVVDLVLKIFPRLLEQGQAELAEQLLPYLESIPHRHKECVCKLAEHYFRSNAFIKAEEKLAQFESYDRMRTAQAWIVELIRAKNISQALVWLRQYFDDKPEHHYIAAIDAMIANNYLFEAKTLIKNFIATPSASLELTRKLRQGFLARLKKHIGDERAGVLLRLYQKTLHVLRLLKQDPTSEEASILKNEVLVELRSQLDKAFLAFYRQHYGNPPRHVGVYFPVVPNLNEHTVQVQLESYFHRRIRQANFSIQHPDVFAFLLRIQPLHNPDYEWLAQLYRVRNTHAHDHDLPLQPVVDGAQLDMSIYLPQVVNGVLALLVQLSHPQLAQADVDVLKFSYFMPHQHPTVNSTSSFFHHPVLPSESAALPAPAHG